jgi:ribosomal protein L23
MVFATAACLRVPAKFGTAVMTLLRATSNKPNNQAVFRVAPKMTKNDIKEYLTKVYSYDVKMVHTLNYEGHISYPRVRGSRSLTACFLDWAGKMKRAGAGRMMGRHAYKERDWKKAYVTFN